MWLLKLFSLFFIFVISATCVEAEFGGDSGGNFFGVIYNTSDTCDPDSSDGDAASIANKMLIFQFNGSGTDKFWIESGDSTGARLPAGEHEVEVFLRDGGDAVDSTDHEILGEDWYLYYGCEDPRD